MKLKEITDVNDLEIGKWYWCFSKKFKDKKEIYKVEYMPSSVGKYIGANLWAEPENNQAMEKFKIYGPIPEPEI